MAELLNKVSVALLVLTLGFAIASLVLNIIILGKENSHNHDSTATPTVGPTKTPPTTSTGPTTAAGSTTPSYDVGNSAAYHELANTLFGAMNQSIDPCDDFYQFTCGTYLQKVQMPAGATRIGVYDQSQEIVNMQIYEAVQEVTVNDSLTERISQKIINACVENAVKYEGDKSADVLKFITTLFGGMPMLTANWKDITANTFWNAVGTLEGVHNVPSIFQAAATVNEQDIQKMALYLNQGGLMMPRDYYVKPQFLNQIEDYLTSVQQQIQLFANITQLPQPNIGDIEELVQFEIELATAMLPDDLLRNYRQQFNRYSVDELSQSYPAVQWADYFTGLQLGGVKTDGFVVAQPTYFAAVNSLFQGKGGVYEGTRFSMKTAVNFVVLRLLQDSAGYIGGAQRDAHVEFLSKMSTKSVSSPVNSTIINCVNEAADLMIYGPGYVYIKSINETERNAVQADVAQQTELIIAAFQEMRASLKWMDDSTKQAAIAKSQALWKNIGWPDFFSFTDNKPQDEYNVNYKPILDDKVTEYWDILQILKKAYQQTENIGMVNKVLDAKWGDRKNFQSSPSTVNAWYQPERNSITFPYAAFNPPYYNYNYPQAYNFAGQGGTGGHELTHGYDDEGVQFGPDGTLGNCTWDYCGWMDKSSRKGFQEMAQCVISQYSSTCCPVKEGAVHCANGATTQGENIADLGGQQAAYHAYQKWKQVKNGGKEEPRLPFPMSSYTPNQIFWITYGHSWCMKQTTENLVNQLLTNPHAPGSCRTNQVVQDIPAFGRDFNCKRGSNMYPTVESNIRCPVWTGV